MPAVEGRIEAGHLHESRISLGQRLHRSQVVRLVQGRERNEALEDAQHGIVHDHRRGVLRSAVGDAVADGDQVRPDVLLSQPGADAVHGGADLRHLARVERLVGQRHRRAVARIQPRALPDAVELAAADERRLRAVIEGIDTELQARRAGVDDEQRVHASTRRPPHAATAARERRAWA